MRYNQICAFLATVECGSIRAAARREGISQPALSHLVKRLEEELGVPLLERSAKGVRLTSYGEALRTRGDLIRAEFERATSEISQMKGGGEGTVNLGLITSVSLLAAGRAVHQFKRRYPKIQISMVDLFYDSGHIALRDGLLDFVIGPMSVTADTKYFGRELLFTTDLVPLVRKGHPKAHARKLADIACEQWIVPVDGNGNTPAMFRENGLELPSLVKCRSLSAWLPLMLENDGIMLLPRVLLRSPLLRGNLQALDIPEATRPAEYYLFTRKDSALTPGAAALAREFKLAVRRIASS
jgi:LysR family transcriptional regulator of abg operon